MVRLQRATPKAPSGLTAGGLLTDRTSEPRQSLQPASGQLLGAQISALNEPFLLGEGGVRRNAARLGFPIVSATGVNSHAAHRRADRVRIIAWSLWDWGSAAYSKVVLTFVFTVYLTDAVGAELPGSIGANSWLGWSLAMAGAGVAILAPITGQRVDAGGRRRLSLGVWTGLSVICIVGMFWVKNDYHHLWLGLVLLGMVSIFFEFASVSHNAMLRQVSTPANIGRVSAFGWSMGYFGGIALLLICYVGFIAPDAGWFGVTAEDGQNIRTVAMVAALWFAVFAIPVLIAVPEIARQPRPDRVGFFASYRVLFHDLAVLHRTDRRTGYFLGASAVFRDGLNANAA